MSREARWSGARGVSDGGATDGASWLPPTPRGHPRVPTTRRSLHITMRDGVRLALDVHLPRDRGEAPLPCIVRQTRYFRGVELREPFTRLPIEFLLDHASHTRNRFVAAGYAWVDVCARGSGASFGFRPCPWSPDEIADGGQVVDWIVSQPWSNGRVGSTGVSYDGTTADFLLVNQHPAVTAIAPRFSLWDVFADVAFPGGIHLSWFTEMWCTFNRALDAGRLDVAFALMLREQIRGLRELPEQKRWLLPGLSAADSESGQWLAERLLRSIARGVRPVDDDVDRALLNSATASHGDNFDVHKAALSVDHRDDNEVSPTFPDESIDLFSPHRHSAAITGSGAAVLSMSGWLDGGYQHSAIKRFRNVATPGSMLLLGPWEHGGLQNISPHSPSHKTAFDQDGALLRFFDQHLRDRPADDPPVRYFTVGEERWKQAPTWPPPQARYQSWFISEQRSLVREAPSRDGVDVRSIDPQVGTGCRSRWNSLLGMLPPTGYGDRREVDRRLLVYRSAPLERALEVTGHPIVSLFLALDGSDAGIFVYLEDEHPSGRVDYVTEGQLRALHRATSDTAMYRTEGPPRRFLRADAAPMVPHECAELSFDLLPTSFRFAAGHRLRLAIAGADADHFERIEGASEMAIHRGRQRASRLELPIVEG